MTHTAVRMDKDLKDRLDRLASARRQPAEDIVREAVADYVDRAEKRDAFHQDARHAWARYQRTGLHLTAEEADAWLARLEAGEDLEPPACHDRSRRRTLCTSCLQPQSRCLSLT